MHKYEGIERYLHINGYIEQLGEIDVREQIDRNREEVTSTNRKFCHKILICFYSTLLRIDPLIDHQQNNKWIALSHLFALSLTQSHLVSLFIPISLSITLNLSFFVKLFISLSYTHSQLISLSLTQSHLVSLFIPISLYYTQSLFLCQTLYLSLIHTLTINLSLFLSLANN